MLKHGYTSVAEFHYLHHQPGGAAYANLAEMAERIAAAAEASGIGLTLLPAFYAHGGFGAQPLAQKQLRFRNDVEGYLKLLDGVAGACRRTGADWGLCFHSLRAATEADIKAVATAHPGERPIHIHIAEQTKEVEDCLAWSGRRPVAWLLDHAPVDGRWCLIHATHLDAREVEGIAGRDAVAGLCPITEANLGDGLFEGVDFLAAGGRFGVGSDSNIEISAPGELKQFEYSQRLKHRARNVLAAREGRSTGRSLYDKALAGGAQALGRRIGAIEAGHRADLVVLDAKRVEAESLGASQQLAVAMFAGNSNPVRDVFLAGRRIVENGRHARDEPASHNYRSALKRLRAAS